MITGVQNFISQRAGLMQEKILSSLTDNQKRIAAVVAVIFIAIGAIYLAITCCRRTLDVQAKELGSPISEKPHGIIASVASRYDRQREDGEELFAYLHDKQFLDPQQDTAIIKVIDDFGDLIRSAPYERRIKVAIFDGAQGPIHDTRPKELDEKGCHFHITSRSLGSKYEVRQLAIDYGFIKKFNDLKNKEDNKSELRALLLQVVDEMKVALQEEEKRVSKAQKK